MAVSDSFLTFVLEQLADLPDVVTKRMFGGVGVYSEETFFAILDNDTLFFKVDAVLAERYRQRGMPPFQPMPDKPPMMGYYQVPADVLEDSDLLVTWARDSVNAGRAALKKPPRMSAVRKRRPRR